MFPIRHFPRLPPLLRPFHSPFVALNAAKNLNAPSSPATVYEKQHDSSPEPHLSSSGTRTYVVSEPDPSNTPYQVPSGAYPTSASYLASAHTPEGSSSLHPRPAPHKEPAVGQSADPRNTAAPGEVSLMEAANTNPGKF